jgi:hypothetical protein
LEKTEGKDRSVTVYRVYLGRLRLGVLEKVEARGIEED